MADRIPVVTVQREPPPPPPAPRMLVLEFKVDEGFTNVRMTVELNTIQVEALVNAPDPVAFLAYHMRILAAEAFGSNTDARDVMLAALPNVDWAETYQRLRAAHAPD